VGTDVPLHASSAGKLILADLDPEELTAWLASGSLRSYTERTIAAPDQLRAELERVRRQRSAEIVDELEPGLASISVPVHSPDGPFAGVIGLSGPTFRLGRARRREVLPRVRAAAGEIERALA
jgi:DNA-binding IclR family transcriptional regulator